MDVKFSGVKVSLSSMQQDQQPVILETKIPTEKSKDMISSGQHGQQDLKIKKEGIHNAVQKLNDSLKLHKTSIHYKYHEELQRYYVTIVDSSTNQVIKEIPPKKFLDIYASHLELLGLITNHKV